MLSGWAGMSQLHLFFVERRYSDLDGQPTFFATAHSRDHMMPVEWSAQHGVK